MTVSRHYFSGHREWQQNLLARIVLSAFILTGHNAAYSQSEEGAGDDQPISVPAESPSASDTQTTTDPAVIPEFTLEEQLDDAHERFLSYFADGLYPQALVAAQQTLQLTREYYGAGTPEAALALTNVATAQTETGDLAGAVANYKSSIELIEDNESIVSPRLVNPLMGLAATQNKMGAFDRGLAAYTRALRINHVELGLHNSEQMIIRDGLTESYLGLSDMEDANFQQETQLRIAKQEYGDDLNELLPATYKLAGWYRRSNQPEQEALLLQNATRAIKKAVGNDSSEQIKMLRSLAEAYQRLDMPAEAIRLLKKAWRINEDSKARDPLLSAEIEVDIGDFYNGNNDMRGARRYYSSAWELLQNEGGDASAALQKEYFGAPVIIWSVQLPEVHPNNSKTATLAIENPDLFREGLLVAEYDIDEEGRTDNVRIIESDPAGLLDKRIRYLLGRYSYRPRFADGSPVATEGIQLRHRFSYLPKTTDKDVEKSTDDSGDRIEYPGDID